MDAATAPGRRAVASIGKSPGIPIIPDGHNVLEVLIGDHGPDLEPGTGAPLGELLSHTHVDLIQRRAGDGRLVDRLGADVQWMIVLGNEVFMKSGHLPSSGRKNGHLPSSGKIHQAEKLSEHGPSLVFGIITPDPLITLGGGHGETLFDDPLL